MFGSGASYRLINASNISFEYFRVSHEDDSFLRQASEIETEHSIWTKNNKKNYISYNNFQ